MSKEQKPTLGSGAIKTRKRNIQTKSDPDAFRNRILQILEEADGNEKKQLSLLDNDSLDYQRYREVFAQIMIAGNIVMPGGSVKDTATQYCVFSAEDDEGVKKIVDLFLQLMRRKPFLRTGLDQVVEQLLKCGSVFSEQQRSNLAYAVALLIARNMLSITVLNTLTMKLSVESGFSIDFFVRILNRYNDECSGEVERLLVLLKNARLDQDAVLEMMPPKERSEEKLNEKLRESGLEKLVEQYEKRKRMSKMNDLTEGVRSQVEEKVPSAEIYKWVVKQVEGSILTSSEELHCVWDGIVKDVDTKKAHQKRPLMLANMNNYTPLLLDVCKGEKMELDLLIRIQHFISADMELLKSGAVRDAVNLLYQKDVLSEETILSWYRRIYTLNKGSAASSNIIRDQMEGYIKWLETAEEESGDEE